MTNDEVIEKLRNIADRVWLTPSEHEALNIVIAMVIKEKENEV